MVDYGLFQANAGDASIVESKLQEMNADYLIIESDISNEDAVKNIYAAVLERESSISQPMHRKSLPVRLPTERAKLLWKHSPAVSPVNHISVQNIPNIWQKQ